MQRLFGINLDPLKAAERSWALDPASRATFQGGNVAGPAYLSAAVERTARRRCRGSGTQDPTRVIDAGQFREDIIAERPRWRDTGPHAKSMPGEPCRNPPESCPWSARM